MIRKLTALFTALFLAFSLPVLAQDEAEGATAAAVEVATDTAAMAEAYPGLESFIDGMVESHRKTLDISGVTVSIVKDGKLVLAKGYGYQDIDKGIPVDPETSLFRIGSTSKLFTWTSVMQQVERGNLDLDADVNTYLKTFQIPDTYDQPITLKHILTHTAGFEEGALGYLINYDLNNVTELRDAMSTYIPARINPPGKYSSYSNYATALAGLIVANVSGMPFDEYVEKNIYAPLGMTQSTFAEPLPERLAGGQTMGYVNEAGKQVAQPYELITGFGPAGAMASSATDMAKFMLAHLNAGELDGNRILSPETTAQMHSVLFQGDKRLGGMAHGFYEEYINGHRLIGHGGDTFQFHTNMLIDEAEELGIFISYATASDTKGRDTFVETFYDHYYPEALEPITPPSDFDERAGRYAGSYQFWRHNETTIEKAMGILGGGLEVAPSGEGTLVFAGFGAPRQYVEIGDNLFRQVDGKHMIAFGENENGEIVDLYIEGLPFMDSSRTPAFEGGLFKMLLPAVCFLLFVTVFLGWCYRRKEYKLMEARERGAIRFSMLMAGTNLLFVIFLMLIISVYKMELYQNIPFIFDLNLVLPIVATLMTIGVVYHAVMAWREGYWRKGRRVHYTLVALAGVYMTIFYAYWNILGFQHY
ncbi:serine hydrolase domain-containing protein [Kordiimonas sp.]|uniref:serine hydrolase domain-containing protein n=1 Tax=Kordiimonas sp. TaxID=1970157 RepID=UPI003A8F3B45